MSNLLDILGLMRQCIPWNTMKQILTSLDISKGIGWDATIHKIDKDLEDSSLSEKRKKVGEQLSQALIEFLYCGEKDFRVYALSDEETELLSNFFSSYQVPKNDFSDNYPLSNYEITDAVIETEVLPAHLRGTSLSLCSIRTYEETVLINKQALLQETIDQYALDEDSTVYARKRNKRQFYDVAAFNKENKTLELRVDKGLGIHPKVVLKYFHQLESAFSKLVSQATGKSFRLNNKIDLFSVIDKLYRSDIGRVCELGFTVNSGSVKSEKARKDPEADIRTEIFHSAGRDAVEGELSPFRIAIEWHLRKSHKDECFPELLLPGTRKSLYDRSKNPLNVGHIRRCFYETDYNKIISQLISLKNAE